MKSKKIVKVKEGTTVLEAARSAGICIESACGGQGKCGKCVGKERNRVKKKSLMMSLSTETKNMNS